MHKSKRNFIRKEMFYMKKKVLMTTGVTMATILLTASVMGNTVFADQAGTTTDQIVYEQGVVTDVASDSEYQMIDDTSFVLSADSVEQESLTDGSIVVVKDDNGDSKALEVTDLEENADGNGYIVKTKEAENLFDVLSSVSVSGTASVNPSDIVTMDGVSVASVQTENGRSSRGLLGRFSFGKKGTAELSKLTLNINKDIAGVGSINGDIVLAPELEYDIAFNKSGIQRLRLVANNKLTFNNLAVKCSEAGEIPLVRLPYTFADGMFTAYLNLNLVYNADGSAYVTYSVSGKCGVDYDGTNTKFVCDYTPGELTYGVDANMKAGVNMQIGLVAYGTFTIMDMNVNTGFAGDLEYNSDGAKTGDIYYYLDGDYGYNSVLAQYGICGKVVVYDKNNSIFRYGF